MSDQIWKKDFLSKCKELINEVDVAPDLVIGILNGGGYLVEAFKEDVHYKTKRFEQIKLQRVVESIKNNPILKILFKLLPYIILDKLRNHESIKDRKSIDSMNLVELANIKIDFKISSTSNNKLIKTILIIDDAIDTGRTVFVVKSNLKKVFPEVEIKIAVISWTLEASIIAPDYYIYKNILVRFPWSKDYKGKDFEKKSFSS